MCRNSEVEIKRQLTYAKRHKLWNVADFAFIVQPPLRSKFVNICSPDLVRDTRNLYCVLKYSVPKILFVLCVSNLRSHLGIVVDSPEVQSDRGSSWHRVACDFHCRFGHVRDISNGCPKHSTCKAQMTYIVNCALVFFSRSCTKFCSKNRFATRYFFKVTGRMVLMEHLVFALF